MKFQGIGSLERNSRIVYASKRDSPFVAEIDVVILLWPLHFDLFLSSAFGTARFSLLAAPIVWGVEALYPFCS